MTELLELPNEAIQNLVLLALLATLGLYLRMTK